MTRTRKIAAGRDVDVRIAELLGWTWTAVGFYWDKGGETYLVPPKGPTAVHATTGGSWDHFNDDPKRRVLFDLPQFSADVCAAMEVVDHLRARDLRPVLMPDWGTQWQCVIYRKDTYIAQSHFHDALALAICEAALELQV